MEQYRVAGRYSRNIKFYILHAYASIASMATTSHGLQSPNKEEDICTKSRHHLIGQLLELAWGGLGEVDDEGEKEEGGGSSSSSIDGVEAIEEEEEVVIVDAEVHRQAKGNNIRGEDRTRLPGMAGVVGMQSARQLIEPEWSGTGPIMRKGQ